MSKDKSTRVVRPKSFRFERAAFFSALPGEYDQQRAALERLLTRVAATAGDVVAPVGQPEPLTLGPHRPGYRQTYAFQVRATSRVAAHTGLEQRLRDAGLAELLPEHQLDRPTPAPSAVGYHVIQDVHLRPRTRSDWSGAEAAPTLLSLVTGLAPEWARVAPILALSAAPAGFPAHVSTQSVHITVTGTPDGTRLTPTRSVALACQLITEAKKHPDAPPIQITLSPDVVVTPVAQPTATTTQQANARPGANAVRPAGVPAKPRTGVIRIGR